MFPPKCQAQVCGQERGQQGKDLVPVTFLLTEKTPSSYNSMQQQLIKQNPVSYPGWTRMEQKMFSPRVQEMCELAR